MARLRVPFFLDLEDPRWPLKHFCHRKGFESWVTMSQARSSVACVRKPLLASSCDSHRLGGTWDEHRPDAGYREASFPVSNEEVLRGFGFEVRPRLTVPFRDYSAQTTMQCGSAVS